MSGIMLLASRPFHINDRIALITWQYGKFPPTMPHGWLEPSYTGTVKGIALIYTRILTDSNAMLKIPNSIVTQSLILNVSHGRQSYIATQFEVPITLLHELHKRLRLTLSKDKQVPRPKEQAFEMHLDMLPTGYLVAVNYSVEKGRLEGNEAATAQSFAAVRANCPEPEKPRIASLSNRSQKVEHHARLRRTA